MLCGFVTSGQVAHGRATFILMGLSDPAQVGEKVACMDIDMGTGMTMDMDLGMDVVSMLRGRGSRLPACYAAHVHMSTCPQVGQRVTHNSWSRR